MISRRTVQLSPHCSLGCLRRTVMNMRKAGARALRIRPFPGLRGSEAAAYANPVYSASAKKSCLMSEPRVQRQRACPARARPNTLLWIDDYVPGLMVYKAIFEGLGFRVLTASCGRQGTEMARSHPVDAVILDYEMPEMNGEVVAASIKKNRPELPVLLFTGSSLVPERVKGVVDAICDKAASREELLATIREVMAKTSRSLPVWSRQVKGEPGWRGVA
jgi:CheY-like chemotaxis protein